MVFLALILSLADGEVGLLSISLGARESLRLQLFIALFSLYFLFADRNFQKPTSPPLQHNLSNLPFLPLRGGEDSLGNRLGICKPLSYLRVI